VWWTFVSLGIALISVVELVITRGQRAEMRAAGRRSQDALRPLAKAEQQEVGRAVRRGRAVDDARLAPAAVAMAEAVMAGKLRPWRWVTPTIFFVWISVPVVAAAVRGRWGQAAVLSLGPVLIASMYALGAGMGRRAERALASNRRLRDG
jgi:hypothetical protein